jgi:hypothetical protein
MGKASRQGNVNTRIMFVKDYFECCVSNELKERKRRKPERLIRRLYQPEMPLASSKRKLKIA